MGGRPASDVFHFTDCMYPLAHKMHFASVFQYLIVICCCFGISLLHAKKLNVHIDAPYAVLVNANSGAILYEKNATTPAFPASLTKVATALFLMQNKNVNLDQMAEVSQESMRYKTNKRDPLSPSYWLERDGSKMGLKIGERMSVRSLLFGLLLVSGNDCANVLAEVGAGSIPVFVEELNDFLKKIGCKNTHFSNPHGLHDASHVTTAFDLGLIASRAMQDSRFRDIVSHKSYINPSTNLSDERFLHQSNALLQRGRYFYPQAIGVKTGFTSFAGYNLIAAAEKDGRTLIAVILGTSQRLERYRDAIRLFRAAFEQKKIHQKLLSENATFTKNVEGASGFLSARLSEDLVLSYYPAEEPSKLVTQLTWNNVSLPIKKGQIVGQVEILDESQHLVMSAPVFSDHDVNASLWWKVIERMYQFFCWLSKSVTHS